MDEAIRKGNQGEEFEQQEALSLAFLRLLEALSPPERAVFLLHEVFDYPFSEIGSMLEKSPANCRQIFHRARRRCRTGVHVSILSRSTSGSGTLLVHRVYMIKQVFHLISII